MYVVMIYCLPFHFTLLVTFEKNNSDFFKDLGFPKSPQKLVLRGPLCSKN